MMWVMREYSTYIATGTYITCAAVLHYNIHPNLQLLPSGGVAGFATKSGVTEGWRWARGRG